MDDDNLYQLSKPILQDVSVEEEDKTDKLEELVRREAGLTGKQLEDAVLDILWRFRNASNPSSSTPAVRHTVIRRNSPAPWQEKASRSNTPQASSPRSGRASPALHLGLSRPTLTRMKSSQQSPFQSPRASPRLAFAHTQSLQSPGMLHRDLLRGPASSAETSEYNSDGIDWGYNDDVLSNASSTGAGDWFQGGEYNQTMEMNPYDMLRSVLRDSKTDGELEAIMEANSFDLSAAIMSLMESQGTTVPTGIPEQDRTFLVGKSMAPGSRPATPSGQAKSSVVCRYWLSTGRCLRADCRFSHDLSGHVCKYWLNGNCLAGDSCIFSHDPAALMSSLALDEQSMASTPPLDMAQPNLSDFASFPSLRSNDVSHSPASNLELRSMYSSSDSIAPPPGFASRSALAPEFVPGQYNSRPGSRHRSPAVDFGGDEAEAFPTLGSAVLRGPKKHHGKRGHGHGHRERDNPSSLADVVRMSPSPHLVNSPRRAFKGRQSYTDSRENSAAAQSIPAPECIPWLETGERANKDYLKARAEAIKHGGARNKFLQSAAQAWNRNDVRAAKALSLRGQSENDLMREAHREAARYLYDMRNQNPQTGEEVFVDLHGLHPAEAVAYLVTAMKQQRSTSGLHRDSSKLLYAIVGTGHHSKGGRDKVAKAVRGHLNDCEYLFREFSVPGDRGGSGGILGIDIASGGASSKNRHSSSNDVDREDSATNTQGKIRILKANDAREGF
ncbi:MAG: hypothetical protein M1828_004241 [Chrysothrix sp. TS-e1954]|nr:MAG: hypothetical protein M1828_004241 [Chrysothrix sp. TS-e1954]